jgi:hypothetical protein
MLSTSAFIYFKEYSHTEQSLIYPSEKLVETVGISVTVLENIMADVAHLGSVKESITGAIENSGDFNWIRFNSCSVQYRVVVDGIVSGITMIFVPWWFKQRNQLVIEGARQKATKRKMNILSHQYISNKVMPLHFYLITNAAYGSCMTC